MTSYSILAKWDTETLIPYAAAVLDPRVKTEFLKAHLREGAEAVIDNLLTHFKELSLVEETIPDRPLGTVAGARSATKSTSFVWPTDSIKPTTNA